MRTVSTTLSINSRRVLMEAKEDFSEIEIF
jgi:hypothetical protein